ncbi:MAG: hypothetical protein AB1861_03505 [Cyanobacteriota bacterium]
MFLGSGVAVDPANRTNHVETFLWVAESIEQATARAKLILLEKHPNCACYDVRLDEVGLEFLKEAVEAIEGKQL